MTTKPRNRLTVSKIVSIGATVEGDDPEAVITLWKAKPLTAADARRQLKAYRIEMQRKRPAMSRKDVEAAVLRAHPEIAAALAKSAPTAGVTGRRRAGPARSVADWGPVVEKIALARLDEQDREVEKIRTEIGDTMVKRSEVRSSAEILNEVDRLANSIAKSATEPMTTVGARVEVWRTHPELKTEIRKAQRLERKGGVVVDAPAKTVADRVREVVDEATRRAAWQPLLEGWGDGQTRNQIISKVRVEVWRSPDGQELRDLERTHGAKPYTPVASSEIRKSRGGDRFARALNLLDSGIWSG